MPVRVVGGLESLKRKLLEKDERESLPLCWKNNYESLLVPFLFVEYILNHLLFKQTLFISLSRFWHMSAHANAVLMDRAVVKVVAQMHTNSSLWPSLSDLSHLNIVLFALPFVWVFSFAVCHPRSLSEMSVNNEFFCHLFIALGIIFLKDSRTPLESHRKTLFGSNGETNPRFLEYKNYWGTFFFLQTLLDLLKQCCAPLFWSAFLYGSVTAMRLTPVTHRRSIFIPWKAFDVANSDIHVNWICPFNRVSIFFWVIYR